MHINMPAYLLYTFPLMLVIFMIYSAINVIVYSLLTGNHVKRKYYKPILLSMGSSVSNILVTVTSMMLDAPERKTPLLFVVSLGIIIVLSAVIYWEHMESKYNDKYLMLISPVINAPILFFITM